MRNRTRSRITLVALAVGLATGPAAAEDGVVAFLQRRDALAADDAAGAVALGRWCEANDLPHQAGQMYRRALAIDADRADAYQAWVKVADTHRLPENAERQAELRRRFPDMKLHVTDHFLILYDTSEQWARNRAALLEKAHDVFYTTFRRVGFRPLPLSERLVCVLFDDHEAYLAYGLAHDHTQLGWAAGYYSTRTNRIVFYDDRKSPQFREVNQKMAALEASSAAQREALKAAADARNYALVAEHRRRLALAEKQLRWYRNRVEAISKVGNAAKTVHEAVHQLAFNSGLQSVEAFYPFWLSEGLATSFETDAPSEPFGPLHPNEERKASLLKAIESDQLVPLEELVAIGRPDVTDPERLVVLYDEAWALFGYLFRYEREALQRYLADRLDRPRGERDGAVLREEFVEAFGDIGSLQRRFDNYLRRLP